MMMNFGMGCTGKYKQLSQKEAESRRSINADILIKSLFLTLIYSLQISLQNHCSIFRLFRYILSTFYYQTLKL